MKYLLIIMFITIATISHAKLLTFKIDCPTLQDLSECTRKCDSHDGIAKIEYMVKGNIILEKNYANIDGKLYLTSTKTHENCKVINENNWVCEDFRTTRVIDGVMNTFTSNGSIDLENAGCAK